jgi:hypothetical protein
VEEVDNVRTRAEESINTLLENFMGINDAELGACMDGMGHISIKTSDPKCRLFLKIYQ